MPLDVAAEVVANIRLSSSYNVLALAAPVIAEMTAPGQFVMVKPQKTSAPLLRRPFSVFEKLRDGQGRVIGLSLLNKRIGAGTSLLYEAEVGERIDCLGPLGRPFVAVDPPQTAWMVAGGVGLAPFATLAETLAERGTPMTLFYGARSRDELYYESFFERLGAKLVTTTEDGSRGEHGRVTAPLERALSDHPVDRPLTMYACGPTPMMRAVAALADRARRPVFVSLEPVMGCGMGGCYSCVVRVRHGASSRFVRSCLDGPVFDGSMVVWNALSANGH